MEVSNHDIDRELLDPLVDPYHAPGASSIRLLGEAADFRAKRANVRRVNMFHLDIRS